MAKRPKQVQNFKFGQRTSQRSLFLWFLLTFLKFNFNLAQAGGFQSGFSKKKNLGPIKLSYIFFFFFFGQKNRNFIGNSNQPPLKLNCLQFTLQISHTTPHLISYQTQFPLLKTQNWWPHFSNHQFSLYIEVILSTKFQIYICLKIKVFITLRLSSYYCKYVQYHILGIDM